MDFIKSLLTKRFAPRWLILQIDLMFCLVSVVLGELMRLHFQIHDAGFKKLPSTVAVFLILRFISFYFTKTYHGVLRYTSIQDAKRIFLALTSGTLALTIFNLFYYIATLKIIMPFTLIIFEYFSTALLMSSFRIFVKIIYSELKSSNVEKKNIIIYGAGESGIITKRTVDHDKNSKKKVVGFFDDDIKKKGKSLEGVPIYNTYEDFSAVITKFKIDEFIISIEKIPRQRKEEIVDMCLQYKVQIKTVPPANDWINGELSTRQIKDFRIEDLLERDAIHLDQDQILHQLKGRVVLVTGACGSIGSELVWQIVKYSPQKLILIDQAETPLYELQLGLKENDVDTDYRIVVADICNYAKIENILQTYKPDIIYHAAAYKHVPLMEENPCEAVITNIAGTKNLADLSVKYGVKKFVFISTDKAVNPTNVMGASKRVAEIYVQSLNGQYQKSDPVGHTRFITTRFGNVLGSNGSVIPRFRKQLEAGGPITVTHPEISRYFMTIPEACQLILEAGMMGKGGEIFIFDMGESVKIADLARKMISLSGFVVGKDIQIVYTGLRPGEKIKEELLNTREKTLPTYHNKIMIGKVREYPFSVVSKEITELISIVQDDDDRSVVAKMKSIVPEFLSNNSIYEELDSISFDPSIDFKNGSEINKI